MTIGDALLAQPIAMQMQLGSRPRANSALNDTQRLAVKKYLREGNGYGAIAMTLGLSVNAIKNITIND